MPVKTKILTDMVVDAAFELVQENGQNSINARAVAKKLNCSTQPIYSCFKSMEDLKQAVIEKATKVYDDFVDKYLKVETDKKYKQVGLAYIMFAKEHKQLFKLLFMRDRKNEMLSGEIKDNHIEDILNIVSKQLDITKQQAYNIHLKMWFFVHGVASMIATNFCDFTNEQINELLTQEYQLIKNNLKVEK